MARKMQVRGIVPAGRFSAPASSARASFDYDVWRVIAACLVNRELSLENVADTMRVHPRTLQRRLARVGLTYKQLVGEVRFDMARYLLALSDSRSAKLPVNWVTPTLRIARAHSIAGQVCRRILSALDSSNGLRRRVERSGSKPRLSSYGKTALADLAYISRFGAAPSSKT
jgi:AraC-like DNA-binding protein